MPIDVESQLEAIGRWLDEASTEHRGLPVLERRSRWPVAIGAIAAAAVILVGIGAIRTSRGGDRVTTKAEPGSSAPSPTTEVVHTEPVVPNVLALSGAEAEARLRAVGLKARLLPAWHDGVPTSVSWDQYPTVGSALPAGSEVIVLVKDDLPAPNPSDAETLPLFVPETPPASPGPAVRVLNDPTQPLFGFGHPTQGGGFDRLVWVRIERPGIDAAREPTESQLGLRAVYRLVGEVAVRVVGSGEIGKADVDAIAAAIQPGGRFGAIVPGHVGDLVLYSSGLSGPGIEQPWGSLTVTSYRNSGLKPIVFENPNARRLVPVQVRGHDGWAVLDSAGHRISVRWQETPDVRVGVHYYDGVPLDDPLAVANSLRPSSAEETAAIQDSR